MSSSSLRCATAILLLLCLSTEALLHEATRGLTAVKTKSPSPKRKPPSPKRKPPSPKRKPPSPKPKSPPRSPVRRCVWSDDQCILNGFYFMTTAVPMATDPYTQKLMAVTGLDWQCSIYTSQKTCNANTQRLCIWQEGKCEHALRDSFACPISKVTSFSTCDYFNQVKAPGVTCIASKPCLWLGARGCVHPTFKSWSAVALARYRADIASGDMNIKDYGCCSSFLSRKDVLPDTCIGLDQTDCKKATAADCAWADGSCDLTPEADFQYELEGLKTADPAFGLAYFNANNYCDKQTSRAACLRQAAPLDRKKVTVYGQPHREEALDWDTYCSGQILGP